MTSQWQNFLRNLGEWRGSFTSLDRAGQALQSTASILTLESDDDDRLVHFRLRRFGDAGFDGPPIRESREDYRTLGRQVVFFPSGSFCKGTLQVSPGTPFGGEFGFIDGDRRHRLVQLHDAAGALESLVLIREFRAGSAASERPALEPEQLLGHWQGRAATITADWPEPDFSDCGLTVERDAAGWIRLQQMIGAQHSERYGVPVDRQLLLEPTDEMPSSRLQFLPDGGYHLSPLQVDHRRSFAVEAGWMAAPGRLECLIRRFDRSGAWQSSSQLSLSAV
jgi:hypothetical protein